MLKVLRSVWLGVTLIALASALLLYSDRDRRQGGARQPAGKSRPRLAVLQWASTDLLDHTVAGIVEGLRRQGFENGRTADIRFYNASGDNTTGNAIARDLVGGRYAMVLTASTLALQAVAKANARAGIPHVFGGVTDPYGAGVGITGSRPDQHPPHLVGVGTFQPVERAIRLARQMNPSLRRIGVVWNPGESNSEACVGKARAVCSELGVQLLEANAGNTSEVAEAVRSTLARGAEAFWVGGDTVAISSLAAIVSAARAARIPVFTNDPTDATRGALFGVGASYLDVGRAVGEMGGKILKGAAPRSFGVENLVPEALAINEAAIAELGGAWTIPDGVRAQARVAAAVAAPQPAAARRPGPGRTYKVGVLYFSAHSVFREAVEGIRTALRDAGFVEGRNLELRQTHPNGDMSLLPQTARQLADDRVDVLVPLSTPCLQALVGVPRRVPVVFGAVSSPVEAGAGRSYTDHLPDVTGAVWTAPNPGLFRGLKALYPHCRTVGVLYNPSDANSMREKETARAMLAEHGMRLVERTVNTSSDIAEAAQSLLAARVEAVFGMGDNTVASGFAGLALVCRKARVPLLGDDNSLMGSGALFSCGASPAIEGRRTGQLIARILLGDPPSAIPFAPSEEAETAVDFEAAAALGIAVPAALLQQCGVFHHPAARTGRPFRIALVTLARTPLLDGAEAGVLRGLNEAGFREKTDYTLKRYCAQGESARLPALLDAARTDAPDLVLTVTTPALIAALKSVKDIPVVFSVAGDPAALGLFTPATRPAQVTGVQGATDAAGDNYEAWGAQAGRLAARVLAGVPPGDLPIEKTRVQEVVEPAAAASAPPAVSAPQARGGPPDRPREIRIVRYNDAQFSADTYRGIMDGLKQQGLQEGRDIRVRCLNAQGDMTTLASIMTAVRAERPDLVMTISTPALQAALRQLGDLPIVFGCVADGVQAGAGSSMERHLPNVTGICTRSPVEAMARLIARSVPGVRAVGTLFSPGEVNAELNRTWFAAALAKENLKLVAVPINGSVEAAEATGALLRSDVQVVAQIMDNNARPAYGQIARRARDAGLAFLCFDSSGLQDGATLSYGRDYYASGIEAAEVAARVLRGTPPAQIPLALTRTETLAVNPALARAHGIVLPPELEKMAKIVEMPTP